VAVRGNGWRAALPGILIRAAILALLLLLVTAVLAPPDAHAFLGLPSPGDIVKKGVKSAFDFVIKTLFGGIPSKVTEAAISWQLHLPSDAFKNSNVHQLETTSEAAAFGLLGLVMTAATLRYWLAGVTEGGTGAEAFLGIVKSLMAALGIVAWPFAFNAAIAVTNHLTHGLIHSHSVHDDISRMLGAAVGIKLLGGAVVSLLVSIVLVVVGTLLMLALLAEHVVLTCALVVMFVGAPLAIVLIPFQGTAWLGRLAFRAFGTLLVWPVLWALCFAAFAAVFQDFINFKGDGGILDKALLKPLTGVGMLYLCVKLPLLATRASLMGIGGGGGFLGFAGRFVAVRQLERGVSSMLGGGSATPDRRSQPSDPVGPPIGGAPSGSAGGAAQSAAGGAGAGAAGAAVAGAAAGGPPGAAAGAAGGAATGAAAGTVGGAAAGGAGAAAGGAGAAAGGTAGGSAGGAAAASAPAALRAITPRAAQLREQMWQNRREGAQHGLPGGAEQLSARDVSAALRRLGPDRAASLQNAHQRAVAEGKHPEYPLGAVTRAASYGAARTEHAGDFDAARAYMVVGSASGASLSEGLASYASQLPSATAAEGAAPDRALPVSSLTGPPAPSASAPPSGTPSETPPASGPEPSDPDAGTPRRGPHKP
jgi:hypothetical protein